MILIIIGFLTVVIIDVYTDTNRIKKNLPINHTRGFFLRLPIPILATWYTYGVTWLTISILILQGAFYWIIFDLLLNHFRGLPLSYLGKSTLFDTFFKTFKSQLLVKFIILIIATLVTYYLS